MHAGQTRRGKRLGSLNSLFTAAPHCIAELMPSTHKLGQLGNAKHRKI